MSFAKIGEIEGDVGRERFLMKGLVQGILNLGCLLDIQVEMLSRERILEFMGEARAGDVNFQIVRCYFEGIGTG